MLAGVLFALGAGLMWGLIFIGPLLVPDYPGTLQSMGRYLAFGLTALPLAWQQRHRLRQLSSAHWREAFRLTLVGNLLYYALLASAVQRTGAPVTTMIIGTLPVVIAVSANLFYGDDGGQLSWRRLIPALLLIACGLACVNVAEIRGSTQQLDPWRYISGIGLALLAVICWTWYPLKNARWLRQHPALRPGTWTIAQGVVTLPLALIGYLLVMGQLALTEPGFTLPLGPEPGKFVVLMLAIAILCSWVGTLCWNEASQRLPSVLLGPLIVFETLAGLAYSFILRHAWPPLLTSFGILCLIVGVVVALSAKPQPHVVVRH